MKHIITIILTLFLAAFAMAQEKNYIYKVRFRNENKNQSNEDKTPLYQCIIAVIAFSLVSILCSCSALFWRIFVSYLFLNSDYSFYLCARTNEQKERICPE